MESEAYGVRVNTPEGAPDVTLEVAPGVSIMIYPTVVVVYSDRHVEVRSAGRKLPV